MKYKAYFDRSRRIVEIGAALNNLAPLANLGSVLGFVFTIVAFVRQRRTKQSYKLLIRGPEILNDLSALSEDLNIEGNDTAVERKTALLQARTVISQSAEYISVWQRLQLTPTRWLIRRHWKNATVGQVQSVYAAVRGLHQTIKGRIRDKQVEQA